MANPDTTCVLGDNRPSPFPAETIGLFEGAARFRCGVYRSEHNCKMRTLGTPFCRVCRELIGAALADRVPQT